MRPRVKAADVNMAVMVTLVFSDEAHREAWLIGSGFIKSPLGKYSYSSLDTRRVDYDRRKNSQNLIYVVGALDSRGKYIK